MLKDVYAERCLWLLEIFKGQGLITCDYIFVKLSSLMNSNSTVNHDLLSSNIMSCKSFFLVSHVVCIFVLNDFFNQHYL